jgi:dipeptidyl aminopeptidase/acylaminoacyl peptidase
MPGFDVDHFLTIPRLCGLSLSPDGSRLVTSIATVAPDGKKFVSALWQVDPDGERPPRRLTRSAPGERSPVFLPDGSLLFASGRKDPDVKADPDADEVSGLWLLPTTGEARLVASAPGGIDAVRVARDRGTVAFMASVFPLAEGLDDDAERAKARKDAGVTALLFEAYPIRYWDHELGPRQRRLFVADAPADDASGLGPGRQLTPEPGRALDEASFDISPDGTTVVTTWIRDQMASRHTDLVAIDTETGDQRVLASAGGADFISPAFSPDGRWLACIREDHGSPSAPTALTVWLIDVPTGEGRDISPELDLMPGHPVWAPDGSALFVTADQRGRTPVFRITGSDFSTVERLSADGSFSDVQPSPDGRVFAVRSTTGSPHEVVVVDEVARPLPSPGSPLDVPGRVEEVLAAADDGVEIRSWLVLPPDASAESPAPLVVFIHGGPVSSWAGWHWRWNPHLLAERGYAVLLPDPALSTGYGQDFIARGWGTWGERPYTDLMTAVDAAIGRPDIDADRTAAMGGSFGGYMANWVAGHTDRFRGIITHASLWALDQFHGTTDDGVWWEKEFGDPYEDLARYHANSPHQFVGNIRTPMLVIHGERDHRVPISEALRLWTDLQRHNVPSRFLFFSDENHWILRPPNVRVWYETVFAFLDEHVLGKDFERPSLL